MEKLERSEALLAMGKRLVQALRSEEDLFSDWMAHLIAERMIAVEASAGAERHAAEQACAQEILRLWQHRYNAPDGVNPLANLVPLARTMESLKPGERRFRYATRVFGLVSGGEKEGRNGWLEFAMHADRAARDVIRFALSQAAEEVIEDVDFKNALNEAIGAQLDVTPEVRLIELIDRGRTEQDAVKVHDETVRAQAARLEVFAKMVSQVAADLYSTCTTPEDPDTERRLPDESL
jgi:hypothetical protein